ncbi:MAG: hypothetical protein IJZ34_08345 [Lachnospiraceae bacterium]|nr:hypothetical protein [Lachnospiraceae bacterium]
MGKKRNFIFTNKKHSEKAIMGTILGMISLVSLGIVIFLSYQKNGETPVSYGLTGLLATIFSMIGLIIGILTLQEKENFRLFPWLGTILNVLALAVIGVLLYVGV